MRLKKIEVKGFKSFADETVIHFNAVSYTHLDVYKRQT